MEYDICVVGLGGIGSAILAHCASRGARAIGLEQFSRGHELGASAGRTRMIRQAYFEDPAYVPLVLRAYELWRELEIAVGEELLRTTGVLTVGSETSDIVAGVLRSARQHDLAVEPLSARDVRTRFPPLQPRPDEVAIFEREGGVLKAERAIAAHLRIAEQHGAATRFEVALTGWEQQGNEFALQLADGSHLRARTLILALGPWVQKILAELGVAIRIQRNVQAWFAPSIDAYGASGFPAFLVSRSGLPAPLYGFPDFGDGVKAAFHGFGELTDAEHLDRGIDHARDIAPLARAMNDWMPAAAERFIDAKACMYSLTRDEHFIVDRHPAHENLILCGGFSGHGFKFAPVIGEIAADLALTGTTAHAIKFLSLSRFS